MPVPWAPRLLTRHRCDEVTLGWCVLPGWSQSSRPHWLERGTGQRQGPAARLSEGHSSRGSGNLCPLFTGRYHPIPTWGSRYASPSPQLLTCPALESLKSFQLHRHHHAVEAAQVCESHHTPGGARGIVVGWGSVLEVPEEAAIRGPLPALKHSPNTRPHLMSRSSSSFAGLSKMASRGLTRSSTPPSCTYCRERHSRSHNSRDFRAGHGGTPYI